VFKCMVRQLVDKSVQSAVPLPVGSSATQKPPSVGEKSLIDLSEVLHARALCRPRGVEQKIFGTLMGHSDQGEPWVSPKVDRSC
jgi:hypothetical protein